MAAPTAPKAMPADPAAAGEGGIPRLDARPSRQGFSLRPVRPAEDADWLHDWLRRDYARFWGLTRASREDVMAVYEAIQNSGHSLAYLGSRAQAPAFLLEHYLPAHDPVAGHYPVRAGDHGIHFVLAPLQTPRHNFSIEVLMAIIEIIFRDTPARRLVVEPDVRNLKIHALNFRAGFRYTGLIQLPTKTAYLGFCNRPQFAAAQRLQRSLR